MAVNYAHLPEIQVWNKKMEVMTSISPEVYEYFQYVRNYRTFGTFTFQLNKNSKKAEFLLDPDAFALVYHDGVEARAGIIESTECNEDAGGASDEMLIVSGRTGGMFSERLAVARTATGNGYDIYTGSSESAMRYFVDSNCINALDAAGNPAHVRAVPNLHLSQTDLQRGALVTYSARYETVAEILETIAYAGDIGWEVKFDREERKFIFTVLVGADHTEHSASPVVFRMSRNNISAIEYLNSIQGSKTFAYTGGLGLETSRQILGVHISDEEPAGFNRREVFVDASHTDVPSELLTSGMSELQRCIGELSLSVEQNPAYTSQQYQLDYNLGDFVTVVYEGIASADLRIIQTVDEIIGGGRGDIRKITFSLGTEQPDIRRIVSRTTQKTIEQLK